MIKRHARAATVHTNVAAVPGKFLDAIDTWNELFVPADLTGDLAEHDRGEDEQPYRLVDLNLARQSFGSFRSRLVTCQQKCAATPASTA